MKASTLILLAISPILFHSSAFAQGSLTPPPGAPAPTMKSLDQIEPRTLISSLPYTISTSGSYRLSSNLSVNGTGITISASGVTLDLNGFTISSTASSATGAAITIGSVLSDITIRNGHIRGSVTESGGNYSGGGFSDGISSSGLPPSNAVVSHVTVSGCLNNGIALGTSNSTLVESCAVQTAGSTGIAAHTVTASSAVDCGSTAISGYQISDSAGQSVNSTGISGTEVSNCYGSCTASATSSSHVGINSYIVSSSYGSGNGYGITAITALNCVSTGPLTATAAAENCSGGGTSGITANTALNCYGSATTGTGISAHVAMNCEGSASGTGAGVNASTVESCYGHNSGTGQGVVAVTAADSYGTSSTGYGVYATAAASNCSGTGHNGLYCSGPATNCYGIGSAGTGIQSATATSCYGIGTGTGISAQYSVMGSYGKTSDTTYTYFGINAGVYGYGVVAFSTGEAPATTNNELFDAVAGYIAFGCTSVNGYIAGDFNYFDGSGPTQYP